MLNIGINLEINAVTLSYYLYPYRELKYICFTRMFLPNVYVLVYFLS